MKVRRAKSKDFFCEGRNLYGNQWKSWAPDIQAVWFIYLHLVNFCMVRGRFNYTID